MSYKAHIESVVKQIQDFVAGESVDHKDLINNLECLIEDVENDMKMIQWTCVQCGNQWKEHSYRIAWYCPNCKSDIIECE